MVDFLEKVAHFGRLAARPGVRRGGHAPIIFDSQQGCYIDNLKKVQGQHLQKKTKNTRLGDRVGRRAVGPGRTRLTCCRAIA
jgi:hypothetical protein